MENPEEIKQKTLSPSTIFVFLYISSFLLYLHQLMSVNVKSEMKGSMRWIQIVLDKFIFISTTKKLAMLAFLYFGEFVKNTSNSSGSKGAPTPLPHQEKIFLIVYS